MNIPVIWLRRDLRLHDNEAIYKATTVSKSCLFVYVIDPWFFEQSEIGWLRVKFLLESLAALDVELRALGNRLVILRGESVEMITKLLTSLRLDGYAPHLYFNYDIQVDYGIQRDDNVKQYCISHGIPFEITHNFFCYTMNHLWASGGKSTMNTNTRSNMQHRSLLLLI